MFSISMERDPLAAGLDDVLGAVGDLHEAHVVDGRDVAGVEEALVVEDLAALALEVGAAMVGPLIISRP
jgi:hypothetical protein